MLIDFPENNCSKTWQDFFEKMKKFLKKSLTSWSVRQDEFGEMPWTIKENALAHWLVRQGELDWIRIHWKVKYKKCLHKCHRLTTCWFIAFWGEPWVRSPSFTGFTPFFVWSLWNLREGMKLHANVLFLNELRVGDTCEGCFCTGNERTECCFPLFGK